MAKIAGPKVDFNDLIGAASALNQLSTLITGSSNESVKDPQAADTSIPWCCYTSQGLDKGPGLLLTKVTRLLATTSAFKSPSKEA